MEIPHRLAADVRRLVDEEAGTPACFVCFVLCRGKFFGLGVAGNVEYSNVAGRKHVNSTPTDIMLVGLRLR